MRFGRCLRSVAPLQSSDLIGGKGEGRQPVEGCLSGG